MTYINLLQENFAFIILILLFITMISIFATYNKILKKHHENKLPTGAFPKLGMVGTIIGLVYVFLEFDIGDINTVIQGTGMAVLSTLFGLIFDLIYSRQIMKYETEGNNENISVYLKELVSEMKGMKSSIDNCDDDSSLLSQMKLGRSNI